MSVLLFFFVFAAKCLLWILWISIHDANFQLPVECNAEWIRVQHMGALGAFRHETIKSGLSQTRHATHYVCTNH